MTTNDATTLGTAATPHEHTTAHARTIALPWHRVTLGAILLLASVLNFWQLDRLGYGNSYYAAAVRSMMASWHNFFFAAFDPGGFVSIDKPPVGFWFQVLSAKLFGYSGVSLLLPSALAGVLSVWLLYFLVARVFGRGAGLLAALAMAVMPVAVASDRSNIIDSILVLCLLLAAWAVSRAVERGSLRWLLLCAVFVGIGFNVKMLEAYLVLPALGLVYLLGAPRSWGTRLAHLGLASLVLLAVSFSWALAVDLTPASQRPWVDSTTTNSEVDLAIGYNGLERLLGRSGGPDGRNPGNIDFSRQSLGANTNATSSKTATAAGSTASSAKAATTTGSAQAVQPGQTQATGATNAGTSIGSGTTTGSRTFRDRNFGPGGNRSGGGGGALFDNGAAGPFRLLDQALGGQAGWLLPLAVIGLAAVALRRRIHFPLDRQHNALLLWGAWLLTTAGFFSVAGFFHSYYLVTLAPAIAALVGIGVTALWKDYANRGWRGWLLPLAVLATAAAQVTILQPYADWSRWLTPLVVGLSVAGVAVLALGRLRRISRVFTPLAAAVAILALLLAPTTWAAETTLSGGGGLTPSAGPSTSGSGFGQGNGIPGNRAGGNDTANGGLLSYLEKHQGSTTYLLAVQNSNSAAPYIIQTGKAVMSLGGFSGNDPILTLAQLKTLVKNNTVRYFYGVGGMGSSNGIGQWVQTACSAVPAKSYGGSATTTSLGVRGIGNFALGNGQAPASGAQTPPSGGLPNGGGPGPGGFGGFGGPGGGGFGGGQTLYDCSGAV